MVLGVVGCGFQSLPTFKHLPTSLTLVHEGDTLSSITKRQKIPCTISKVVFVMCKTLPKPLNIINVNCSMSLSLQDEHFIETKELKEKFSSKMTGVEKGFAVMMDAHVAEMYQLKRSVDEKLMMVLNAQSPQQQLSYPNPLLQQPSLLVHTMTT